jgi:hypothetical protein
MLITTHVRGANYAHYLRPHPWRDAAGTVWRNLRLSALIVALGCVLLAVFG